MTYITMVAKGHDTKNRHLL